MDEKDKLAVGEFKRKIPQNIRRHMERIIVCGSRARGWRFEFSDLGIALIVDKKGPDLEKKFEETACRVVREHNFKPFISLKLFSILFGLLEMGFYRNIEREGIVL
ncbi:MAG: hypothetical protein ACQEP5_08750 [Actinomycetota bacterium]